MDPWFIICLGTKFSSLTNFNIFIVTQELLIDHLVILNEYIQNRYHLQAPFSYFTKWNYFLCWYQILVVSDCLIFSLPDWKYMWILND